MPLHSYSAYESPNLMGVVQVLKQYYTIFWKFKFAQM